MSELLSQQSTPFAMHGIIALFGAVVHALTAYRDGKSKSWVDHIMLSIIASFSGVMFGLAGIYWFGAGSYPALLITGVGGYIGPPGMSYLTDYVFKLLKAKK